MIAPRRPSKNMLIVMLSIILLGGCAVWLMQQDQRLLLTVKADSPLVDVAFSPDGLQIATASTTGNLQLWKVTDGSAIHTFRGHDGRAVIAFGSDGSQLASAGIDRTVRLWNSTTGSLLRTFWSSPSTYDDAFYSIAYSSDGSLIAVGSNQGRVLLFRTDTGKLLKIIQAYSEERSSSDSPVRHIIISRDNTLLLTVGSEGVKLWQLPTGRLVKYFSSKTTPGLIEHPLWGVFDTSTARIYTFYTIGIKVVSGAYNVWSLNGQLHLPLPPEPPLVETFKGGAHANSFAVSSDAKILAWGGGIDYGDYGNAWFLSLQNDPRIIVWRLGEAEPAYILTGHRNNVEALAFSPNSQLLASVSRDQTLRVWRLSN